MIAPLDLPSFLNPILTVLLIGLTVGGFTYAFRNGRSGKLVKDQKDTIDLLEQRTRVLEAKVSDLEKQNAVQQHIIDTVTSALEQEGRYITINGDLVTISDKDGGGRKVYRKRVPRSHLSPDKEDTTA